VKSVKSAVQFLWLRLAALGILSLFCGKSIEVPLHEPFTRHTELFQSSPVKRNQALRQ
jgi:hypothetical protein